MAQKLRRASVLLEDGQHAPAVLKKLRAAGFKVESSLEEVGVVTGSIAPEKLAALKKIRGVKSVEAESGFQIAPPDSPVQ